MPTLIVKDLQAQTQETKILRGVNITVQDSEIVALMGPNGSGKSTLANVIMGHPDYVITGGQIILGEEPIHELPPEERAARGLFLAFQYPQVVAGVTLGHMLRLAYNATHSPALSVPDFLKLLRQKMALLAMPEDFLQRPVNEGLSGGEKKRAEMLQLAVLSPKVAILDETDSGLDVDALKVVGEALHVIRDTSPALSLIIITHYQRILDYVKPDRVAVMHAGRIVGEGGSDLLQQIDREGYRKLEYTKDAWNA